MAPLDKLPVRGELDRVPFAQTPKRHSVALEVLEACGAKEIETADGQWRDGKWIDFDPVAPPDAETTAQVSLRGVVRPR